MLLSATVVYTEGKEVKAALFYLCTLPQGCCELAA
jgi:hypothetical protein